MEEVPAGDNTELSYECVGPLANMRRSTWQQSYRMSDKKVEVENGGEVGKLKSPEKKAEELKEEQKKEAPRSTRKKEEENPSSKKLLSTQKK